MALKVKIDVRNNTLLNEKVASARLVDLQTIDFDTFCEYLAQDSTCGEADVAAVMKQLEKKLPLLLSMNNKVQISQGGIVVRPTVSGSLTQTQLKAALTVKKESDSSVDADRTLTASDLTISDLTAGVAIDFSKKFNADFSSAATFKRVSTGTSDTSETSDTESEDSDTETPDTGA